MIRRLAYVSRPRLGLSLVEIPRIVSISRANNEVNGITGVLLFTGLDFAALIEGDPRAVADTWARVRADHRHRDLITVLDEQTRARWFVDWRVGFPSDVTVSAHIASWRDHPVPWDDARSEALRQLMAAADAL